MIGCVVSLKPYWYSSAILAFDPKKYCMAYNTLDLPQLFGPIMAEMYGEVFGKFT